MKIDRIILGNIKKELHKREISILLGPRQVGKTFLLKEMKSLAEAEGFKTQYYNLELPSDIMLFNKSDSEIFDMLTGRAGVIFIDEFHYLKNASKLFKAVYDSGKKIKIFCSGSSSVEIHKHLRESLTGRRMISVIYPLVFTEFSKKYKSYSFNKIFKEYIMFGGLPGLVHLKKEQDKIRLLNDILETYIQKDIKSLIKEENIRAFNNLLYLLAENQGSLISVNSLANEVGLTAVTVDRHLTIMDNTYVTYSLSSYSKNIGNELKKSRKIYLYDQGIRNAILKDFSISDERPDKGVLHETFVLHQLKSIITPEIDLKFWRNKAGLEIDFVLLKNRKPLLIEVKSELSQPGIPPAMKIFIKKYKETQAGIVISSHYKDMVMFEDKKIYFETFESFMERIKQMLGKK
jgi:predicted AAA+ superfamily ATPase